MACGSIYANYIDMLNQADRLSELAGMLKSRAQAASQNVEADINAGWTGDAANECRKKNDRLACNAIAHARQLEWSAELLRGAAREYYRIEMMSQVLFGG